MTAEIDNKQEEEKGNIQEMTEEIMNYGRENHGNGDLQGSRTRR